MEGELKTYGVAPWINMDLRITLAVVAARNFFIFLLLPHIKRDVLLSRLFLVHVPALPLRSRTHLVGAPLRRQPKEERNPPTKGGAFFRVKRGRREGEDEGGNRTTKNGSERGPTSGVCLIKAGPYNRLGRPILVFGPGPPRNRQRPRGPRHERKATHIRGR